MKAVVHVMGMRSSKYGGLERFMCCLAKQLKAQNRKFFIIYESVPASKEYITELESHNAEIIILPSRGFSLFKFASVFTLFLIKETPSVVHCHFQPASYIVLFISWLFQVEYRFQTMHSMLTYTNNKSACKTNGLSRKTKLLKKLMYRFTTHIFSVSDGIKDEFRALFGDDEKITTVYLGVGENNYNKDEGRDKYQLPSDGIIISCVAFHEDIKGIDILVEAVAILIKKYRNTDVFICQVGGGNPEKTVALKDLSKKLNISTNIRWMGLQDNVPEILAASDIYCQPSRSEGIPLSIMEASMASLPTVASNVGGIPEAVNDELTGYLVPSETPELLAEKLDFLINNERIRVEMGRQAKNTSLKNFEIHSQSKILLEYYGLN